MRPFYNTLLFFMFGTLSLSGQMPEWAWASGGGGCELDYGTSISLDANRNLYLTGWFNSGSISFGGTTLTNNGPEGTSDIFIAKYNADGDLLWVKNYGGAGDDRSVSIKTNGKGSFALTGWFKTAALTLGSTTLKNSGGSDILIARFDEEGTVLWAKSAGGIADDEGSSISCDAADNIYVTGMYESASLNLGKAALTNVGNHDIFLASYDKSGQLLWAKNIGGKNDDNGSTVTTDVDGNIYLSGKFRSATVSLGEKTLSNAGKDGNYGDIFMAKYNTSGKLIWVKSLGGSYYDEVYSITTDTKSNVYLTGWFKSDTIVFGCDTLMECTILTRAHGVEYGDVFIAKYDTYGEPVWAKRAGGMAKDYGFGITTNAAGDVYLTGIFESNYSATGQMKLTNARGNDIFISKYNPDGKVLWAKSIYGSAMARCITTDVNGDVYFAGVYHALEMRFGDTLLKNAGEGDIFVAKLK